MADAEIIAIGSELLTPDRIDTNSLWLTSQLNALGVEVRHSIDEVLDEVDAVMMLRIQRERMSPGMLPSDAEYSRFYGLDRERLARRPDLVVMHPGPMNRGLEIASEVADDPRSVIFLQKHNGVAVRMAVLARAFE